MEIPISSLHAATVTVLAEQLPIKKGVTDENIQARLRGLLLMALANDTDRMVIATGNKTELGLGYCTLYGDMVGGLLLIGDLNKLQVYRVADYVNQRAGRPVIPREVMDRSPSAELAHDQKDPFDYPLVAPMVDDLIARRGPEEILAAFHGGRLGAPYPADLYSRYDGKMFQNVLADTYRRYQSSAFKRAQASPTIIVSNRALGFDLRETIINRWRPDLALGPA
jgi:NAD+ synthase (glutamine-hydrolysing)